MKKIHIIGIIIIAVATGAILTSLMDAGTYADFSTADKNPGAEYHVVGKLNKDKPHDFNPELDANKFTFFMFDNNGIEKKVILYKSKPQDFENAEQIVLIGKSKGNEFHATEILMKCPSKYNSGTPTETSAN
jgi:cytochrome c-type biogenesis protein CcmE